MKTKQLIFLVMTAVSMTGCQSMLDSYQELNRQAIVDYNKRAVKPESAQNKCWKGLQNVNERVQKTPALAEAYAETMHKKLTKYEYGSGCMHVPGYPQALEQAYLHASYVASTYSRPYKLR